MSTEINLAQLRLWEDKMYVRYNSPYRYRSWGNALAAEIHGPRGVFELELSDLNIAEKWYENGPPKRYLRKTYEQARAGGGDD